MHNIAIKLFSAFLNIIIPGTGLFVLGYKKIALVLQLSLMSSVAAACWSRAIFLVPGLSILITTVLAIYIISTIACIWVKTKADYQKTLHHILIAFLFFIFCSSIFIASFIYKDRLFGVHLFYVPSMSMYPTLKAGQFILLDSWAYNENDPQLGDIIVFNRNDIGKYFVKRISNWPSGILINHGKWYVLGDNLKHSRDSRIFGGVEKNHIIGRVRIVLPWTVVN